MYFLALVHLNTECWKPWSEPQKITIPYLTPRTLPPFETFLIFGTYQLNQVKPATPNLLYGVRPNKRGVRTFFRLLGSAARRGGLLKKPHRPTQSEKPLRKHHLVSRFRFSLYIYFTWSHRTDVAPTLLLMQLLHQPFIRLIIYIHSHARLIRLHQYFNQSR